eukprot:tig00000203_g17139.t1
MSSDNVETPAAPAAAADGEPEKKLENLELEAEQNDGEGSSAQEAGASAPPPEDHGLDPEDETAELRVQQNDPNSPLYSVKKFEELGLKQELLDGIYGMGFSKPSKIQEASLPIILAEPPRNLIGQAHNGSGKTACFALGMLSRVDTSLNQPQALCVVNTRELARQIMEVAQKMGKFTKITYFLAVPQSRTEGPPPRMRVDQQVVIGTPGTVMNLIKKNLLSTRSIKIFVLDEADEMLDTQGFGDDSIRIKKMLPRNCQSLLFSATYPERVATFAVKLIPDASIISVKREKLSIEGIKQLYIDCGSEPRRFEILSEIYALLTIGQSIIFVNRRETAQDVSRKMRAAGHTVSVLHGTSSEMTAEDRDKTIDDFRTGKTKVLITTNVLSRGIDISQVSLVINYDMPFDKYAIAFVYDENSRRCLQEIEKFYNRPIRAVQYENLENLEKILKEV